MFAKKILALGCRLVGMLLVVGLCAAVVSGPAPYRDSARKVWPQLPQLADFPDVAAFDERVGHEVFRTSHGRKFQFDRELTEAESDQAARFQEWTRRLPPVPESPIDTIRTKVTLNLPVDTEYIQSFATKAQLKAHVIGLIARASSYYALNFGIDVQPRKGWAWDSPAGKDIIALLDDAIQTFGTGQEDVMMAFSNQPTGPIGAAYVGLPYCIVKKYQTFEAEIAQHELAHCYTLRHCCTHPCIMQPVLSVSSFNVFHKGYRDSCSGQDHYDLLWQQRFRY